MLSFVRTLFAALLLGLPVLIGALASGGAGLPDHSAQSWLSWLAGSSGQIGLMALLLATLLSLRLPGIDPLLGGLTTVWRLHHYLGITAFLLLMAHPLLIGFAAYARAPHAALAALWPPLTAHAIWLGWWALLLLFVVLGSSFKFWGEPHYQRWKNWHALSGLAVLLALLHGVWLTRRLPGTIGTLFWLGIGVLALSAFLYRTLLSRKFGVRHYRLKRIEHLAADVAELVLAPISTPLQHRPGQFVYLRHFDATQLSGFNEEHPYTVSSAPGDAHLRLGIKALGDASRATLNLRPQTLVTVEGPYGHFFLTDNKLRAELWIGGGIGITPFVSRLRALQHSPAVAQNIHLFYCADREERACYLPLLTELVSALNGVQLHMHYFQQFGALNRSFLQLCCPDFASRLVYLCGPPAMNQCVHRLLRDAGVPRHDIRSEEFTLL